MRNIVKTQIKHVRHQDKLPHKIVTKLNANAKSKKKSLMVELQINAALILAQLFLFLSLQTIEAEFFKMHDIYFYLSYKSDSPFFTNRANKFIEPSRKHIKQCYNVKEKYEV